MIGRSIVATTVRSSAATNTLKPTTARIAAGDGRRRVVIGAGARSTIAAGLRLADVGGRLDLERVAVMVELELPVGRGAVEDRLELGRRHEVGVRVDPHVDGDVLTRDEPHRDVGDLGRRSRAGDVVAVAT